MSAAKAHVGKALMNMAQTWANLADSDLALFPIAHGGFAVCACSDDMLLACALDLRAVVVRLGLTAELDADAARDFGLEPLGQDAECPAGGGFDD